MKNLPKDHLDIKNFDEPIDTIYLEEAMEILNEYRHQFDSEEEAYDRRRFHHHPKFISQNCEEDDIECGGWGGEPNYRCECGGRSVGIYKQQLQNGKWISYPRA